MAAKAAEGTWTDWRRFMPFANTWKRRVWFHMDQTSRTYSGALPNMSTRFCAG
jgi:hypothetical protein